MVVNSDAFGSKRDGSAGDNSDGEPRIACGSDGDNSACDIAGWRVQGKKLQLMYWRRFGLPGCARRRKPGYPPSKQRALLLSKLVSSRCPPNCSQCESILLHVTDKFK